MAREWMYLLFYLSCVSSFSHMFTRPAPDPHLHVMLTQTITSTFITWLDQLNSPVEQGVLSASYRQAKPIREHFPHQGSMLHLAQDTVGPSMPTCAGETRRKHLACKTGCDSAGQRGADPLVLD